MKQSHALETILSALVLVVAVVFLFHVYRSTGGAALSDYALTVQTRHADGLKPGSDVRINGIKVGTVTDLTLDHYVAKVSLRLHDEYKIPADSQVVVSADGFNPGSYLAIQPGRSSQTLAPGGEIGGPVR